MVNNQAASLRLARYGIQFSFFASHTTSWLNPSGTESGGHGFPHYERETHSFCSSTAYGRRVLSGPDYHQKIFDFMGKLWPF
jgi:hypothetical protein